MPEVLFICCRGTELGEFAAPFDCLFRAGANLTTAKVKENEFDTEKYVTTFQGIKIVCDCFLEDVKDKIFDMIVFPGGLPNCIIIGGNKLAIEIAMKHKNEGKWYAAICASPCEILKKNNISEGEKLTWNPMWGGIDFKDYENKRVVVSGKCITSQGPGTSYEFGVALVEALFGKEKREELEKGILFKAS